MTADERLEREQRLLKRDRAKIDRAIAKMREAYILLREVQDDTNNYAASLAARHVACDLRDAWEPMRSITTERLPPKQKGIFG